MEIKLSKISVSIRNFCVQIEILVSRVLIGVDQVLIGCRLIKKSLKIILNKNNSKNIFIKF